MISHLRLLLLAATALIAFPAFAQDADEEEDAPKPAAAAEKSESRDFAVIKIGSDEIRNSEVMDAWKALFPGGTAPDFNSFDENIRQNVLRGLVSEKLIYQEAVRAGYDKDAEVKKRIASLEKQVVIQSFMDQKSRNLVTDEQLHSAYAAKVAAAKGQEEIKARHILVASEEEAQKLHEQIKKGADFEKLAKEKSTDKSSGVNGGELGWFTKDKMVAEFADASFKLKKGDVSEPIKSEFGWHLIKVEDRRPLKVAPYDDMKESLKGELANKAVQTYVEGLLKKADIKYYGADGREKSFNRSLSPAAGGPKE